MNADALDEFYRRIGAAIWHVQYLEDLLVSFLATKILSPKRSSGHTIRAEEMEELLALKRRLTLGQLIQGCIGQGIITPSLQPRFEKFKTDRHWLVHRSVFESGDDLFNESKREAVLRRIYSVQEEAIALKKVIALDMQASLAALGVDIERATEQGEAAYRKLAGL
jgi:hypothetical protein